MLDKLVPSKWSNFFDQEKKKTYWKELDDFLDQQESKTIIHPHKSRIFYALENCPPEETSVIILGQDPYHGQNQAMGLSFSVPYGIPIPPSLRNIYKELMTDIGIPYPSSGDLTAWAKQGVLLLNSILTVEHKNPGSHAKIGWQFFTDNLIQFLSEDYEHLVFLLWGKFAQTKKVLIDESKHLILEAAHPSPLAGNKFFGSKHFSKTNEYLTKHNKQIINWNLN